LREGVAADQSSQFLLDLDLEAFPRTRWTVTL